MSIDIRETKQLNQKKKSDTLGEILGRLEVIEGKIDTLAYGHPGKFCVNGNSFQAKYEYQ